MEPTMQSQGGDIFGLPFKALYRTDKISMSNSIGATFDNFPKENTSGSVFISLPPIFRKLISLMKQITGKTT